MDKDTFCEMIRQIPKAEIHLHLEDFVASRSINVASLPEFLSEFRSLRRPLTNVKDFGYVFDNVSNYMKRNGIVYAEVFFSPTTFLRTGWKYADIAKFFDKKIKNLHKSQKLTIKVLIDLSRTYGAHTAEDVLDEIIANPSSEIIGIGLGGDEKLGPACEYAKVFEKARAANLHAVAHAGEDDSYKSVIDTIEQLGAERIGHAIAAASDVSTMQLLAAKKIPVEIALTSNVVTGKFVKTMEEHPVRTMLGHGVFITLNTDDPTLFNTSLILEYWNLYSKLHFTLEEIYFIIINGFKASFISKAKKRVYYGMVNKKWSRNFAKIGISQTLGSNWQINYKLNFEKVE